MDNIIYLIMMSDREKPFVIEDIDRMLLILDAAELRIILKQMIARIERLEKQMKGVNSRSPSSFEILHTPMSF